MGRAEGVTKQNFRTTEKSYQSYLFFTIQRSYLTVLQILRNPQTKVCLFGVVDISTTSTFMNITSAPYRPKNKT